MGEIHAKGADRGAATRCVGGSTGAIGCGRSRPRRRRTVVIAAPVGGDSPTVAQPASTSVISVQIPDRATVSVEGPVLDHRRSFSLDRVIGVAVEVLGLAIGEENGLPIRCLQPVTHPRQRVRVHRHRLEPRLIPATALPRAADPRTRRNPLGYREGPGLRSRRPGHGRGGHLRPGLRRGDRCSAFTRETSEFRVRLGLSLGEFPAEALDYFIRLVRVADVALLGCAELPTRWIPPVPGELAGAARVD